MFLFLDLTFWKRMKTFIQKNCKITNKIQIFCHDEFYILKNSNEHVDI